MAVDADIRAEAGDGMGEFRVMRASAGSGKTFRLVEAYLSTCLASEDPLQFRRILALTFTNKAAQEMKDRVVEELDRLASDPSASRHLDGLKASTGVGEEELVARAVRFRRTLQRHYGELSIMTLDRFVKGLVHGFAADLQVEHDFSIEVDTLRLLEQAVDRVLERMGHDRDLTELLGRFVEQAVEDDQDAKVRKQLLDIGVSIDREQMQPLIAAFGDWSPARFLEVQDAMRRSVKAERSALRKKASDLLEDLNGAGLQEVFTSKWVTRNWLPSIVKGKVEVRGATLRKGLEQGVWAKSKDTDGEAAIAPFHDRLEEVAMLELAQAKCEAGRGFRTRELLARHLPLIGTLTALSRESLKVQQEENVRTTGTLNAMIAEVVAGNPAPYIFERTGERFDHIFIDEFQDTSVTQWQNLAVAVGESLSQGHLSLVVGDAKQAIYRFRNGDHRQLLALPGLVQDGPSGLPPSLQDAREQMRLAFRDEPIVDNWRSAPRIVEFNNALYSSLGRALGAGLDEVYHGQEQVPRKSFAGAVEVEVIQADKADDRFEQVCQWMEARIRQALAAGFRPGDVALLVRTNKEAKRLAEFLLGCTPRIIPFTDESLALGRHPAAWAVIHMLEVLADPDDHGPVLRFLQAWGAMEHARGNPWDEAAWLDGHHEWVEYRRHDDSMGRKGVLRGDAMLGKLVPGFDRARWSALPLGECMGRVLSALGVDRHYPAHAEALMELTSERAALDQGLSGFLAHWERKGAQQSIRVLPGPDSVRILTVHKSKGLQYPVVITRFDDALIHKPDALIPAPLNAEEYGVPGVVVPLSVLQETAAHETWELEQARQRFDVTNVAYVCTTRAEVRLHVVIDVRTTDWASSELPGQVGRMVAKGIEDAFDCNLAAGPWHYGDMEAACPLEAEGEPDTVEAHAIPAFVFHGIPDEVLAGRREERLFPVLGTMDRRTFGNAVHEVLSRIRSTGDAERILARPWPWLRCAKEDWDKVKSAVGSVMEDAAMAPWFDGSGRVFAERELAAADGGILRPDRVVEFDDRVDVVDFKTSEEADPSKQGAHVRQVRGYMQVLQRRTEVPVRGFLYYVGEGRLKEVTAE